MNLEPVITKIFEENFNYSNPGQAVNQASSLDALSGDLYTDSRRFIYELLQNADDSCKDEQSVKVWIKIFDDQLVVAHSGKSFDARDIQGICNVNNGTKKSDSSKTGYKGIGFKSVFGQSENVVVFTNDEYFRFDSQFDFEWNWEIGKTEWEKKFDRKFQFPWQIIPIYTKQEYLSKSIQEYLQNINATVATIILLKNPTETKDAIQNLSSRSNMFLFLKNISEINFEVQQSIKIEINRHGNSEIILRRNGVLEANWLVKSIRLEVPDQVKTSLQDERNIPDKLVNAETIDLTLGVKIEKDGISKLKADEKLLYAYLPTDETKYSLPVLANTSFLTTANRESLHADSKWNQWIFKNIAIEIFKWIAELVNSKHEYQAYRLIPELTFNDELGRQFNDGITEALETVPFIITNENELVLVKETIVDFTFLSEKEFIGGYPIENYIKSKKGGAGRSFSNKTGFGSTFKKLGASCFEWSDLGSFFKSEGFLKCLTITNNIKLIQHLKTLSDSDDVKNVRTEVLKSLPFIRDHKGKVNYPTQICFPAPDDENWNDPENELSFVHPEILDWVTTKGDIRSWLEVLGVIEKTDITYIHQTILPNVDTFITIKNAINTVRGLFQLYRKGDLHRDLISQLSRLKLFTQEKTLIPANDCFLSNFYRPRLEIEDVLEQDIFVGSFYCEDINEIDEWKRFFKIMGVNEGVSFLKQSIKQSSEYFIDKGIDEVFIREYNNKFYSNRFSADSFSNIVSLPLLSSLKNHAFAVKYWNDVIFYIEPNDLSEPAKAYWGYSGMSGQNSGVDIESYIYWYIKNIKCIPVVTGECEISDFVILNTEENKTIAGNYLPVFDGPELTPDWRSFFSFKTKLELSDYLLLLNEISNDVNKKERIKKENYERIQLIYSVLLDQCVNWSREEINLVEKWASEGSLLNTNSQFSSCSSLKYFFDGNESIFQEQFEFISIDTKLKNHARLEAFLKYFQIGVLKQDDFSLISVEVEECLSLRKHIEDIIPCFKNWVESETKDDKTKESLNGLPKRLSQLTIFQAKELQITYDEIDFVKNVNVHLDKTDLYISYPWDSNSVLLKLSEVLCRFLYLYGHDKKLDFLLRSSKIEIQNFFSQENISVPDEFFETSLDFPVNSESQQYTSFTDITDAVNKKEVSPEFFHLSNRDYNSLKAAEKLVKRAVSNILEYLGKQSEYDCSNYYLIADSIIGGIIKDGNEITVVARPSDENKVLLYYTSEYDVLDYVNAEFWYEDGEHLPKQITLGQLLKKTGINRIPVSNVNITNSDIKELLCTPPKIDFDFSAVPYVPQKLARELSAFANTEGGTLIFGLKNINHAANKLVGLSADFRVTEITRIATSLLSPVPSIKYDWIKYNGKDIFGIQIEKADHDILFNNEKFIRDGDKSIHEISPALLQPKLNISNFNKTIAIVIAIEDYKKRDENQVSKVKYAKNDADRFIEMLVNNMGVDRNDIYPYINEDALKNDLEYDLSRLFHQLSEHDRLIFYYVGHGFHDGVGNYLSTYDMHPFNISSTAVSLRKILLDPLQKSQCDNALIFIDACAQSFQNENERSQVTNLNDEEFLLLKNDFPYYGTFLSCLPGQSSYSSDILKNGIWTHHLIKAISGEVLEVIKGGIYITDTSLKNYLSDSVANYTEKELGYIQNPKAILDSSYENVIVEIPEE